MTQLSGLTRRWPKNLAHGVVVVSLADAAAAFEDALGHWREHGNPLGVPELHLTRDVLKHRPERVQPDGTFVERALDARSPLQANETVTSPRPGRCGVENANCDRLVSDCFY
jgi:hypothetical protein